MIKFAHSPALKLVFMRVLNIEVKSIIESPCDMLKLWMY